MQPVDDPAGKYQAQPSMQPFSFDLTGGFIYFADAATVEEDVQRRRYFNTACIVFAAGAIEAVINERISLESVLLNSGAKRSFYEALAVAQRSINLKDKWNLFVSVRGGHHWDSAEDPTSHTIQSLRFGTNCFTTKQTFSVTWNLQSESNSPSPGAIWRAERTSR